MGADKSVEVHVTGRVQGVFFRAATREQAQRLGVRGWVRNQPDGSVTAHLEGPAEAVDALLAWCRQGPPSAHVEEVRDRPVPGTGTGGFQVLD